MPQNSWDHCNSFAHFQKAFWAPCRVHWLSLLNVELCKTDDGSCPMPSLQHTVYKQQHWTAEATGLCLCKSCYSGILLVESWMQEKHILNMYKGPPNRRSKEKPLIRHSPADVGSVSAEKAASCTMLSMCRMETNVLKELQLIKGEKLINSTLLLWFIASGPGKNIKTLEIHPCCASEWTSGRNRSVVRKRLPGSCQLIWSITISLQSSH